MDSMSERSESTVLLCKAASFKEGDFTFCVEVAFIADKNNDYVGTGECARVRQPVCQRVVSLTAAHI